MITQTQFLAVVKEIAGALEKNTTAAAQRIQSLEKRLAELERVQMVATQYRSGDTFEAGAHCVADGHLFRCVRRTAERPSASSTAWTAVSAGSVHYVTTPARPQ